MITSNPKRNMSMYDNFHGKPTNSFHDTSVKANNVNHMVALEEMSSDHQSH